MFHQAQTMVARNANLRPVAAAPAAAQTALPLPSVPTTIAAATTVPTTVPTTAPAAPAPPPLVVPTDPAEWFNPRGANAGTEGIVSDLAKLGIANNSPLYVNECWGRTWGATTSDHYVGQTKSWACDISIAGVQVPTPQADEAARRIASALGVQGWKGGDLVKTINGYRIQVLWRVADHYNHVHVGARKVS